MAKAMEKNKESSHFHSCRIVIFAFAVFWFSMDNKQFVLFVMPSRKDCTFKHDCCCFFSSVFDTQKTDFSLSLSISSVFFLFVYVFICILLSYKTTGALAMEFYNVLVSDSRLYAHYNFGPSHTMLISFWFGLLEYNVCVSCRVR